LGTREIEEAVNMHPNIAECAVVGVADALKGQMPLAFAVLKDPGKRTSAEDGAFRDAAAEDPLREDPAALDPGARRGPRPGRSHHHRRSRCPAADPRRAEGVGAARYSAKLRFAPIFSRDVRASKTRAWTGLR